MKKIILPTTFFKEFVYAIFNTASLKREINYFSIVFGLVLLSFSSTAQVDTNSMWTWMSGANIANQDRCLWHPGYCFAGHQAWGKAVFS